MSVMKRDSPEESVAQSPARARPLWRNRDYLLLLSGQGISSIGSQVSQFAFPLLVLALTHSPAQAGAMAALRGLPYVLLCLPAGALVDRWNRKRVMIICDAGRAIALASIPLLFALGYLSIVQLYLVALVEGTLFVFFSLAESATLPHVVTKEQLATATGQNELLNSSSIMLGPALGGILYSVSAILPFLGDAVSYAASVLSLFFIKVQFQGERSAEPQHLWTEVKEGLLWLWHNSLIRFLAILTGGLITPCVGYYLIVIELAQRQHASAETIGFILAAGGAGSALGALVASPLLKRFGFSRVIVGSAWIWALLWLLFVFAPNPLILGLVNGLSYAIVPVYMVTQYSYRLAMIPDHLQGRVNSVFRLIVLGGQPVGLAATGLLLQTIGPIFTVLVLFVPQLVMAVAATLNKSVREASSIEAHGR